MVKKSIGCLKCICATNSVCHTASATICAYLFSATKLETTIKKPLLHLTFFLLLRRRKKKKSEKMLRNKERKGRTGNGRIRILGGSGAKFSGWPPPPPPPPPLPPAAPLPLPPPTACRWTFIVGRSIDRSEEQEDLGFDRFSNKIDRSINLSIFAAMSSRRSSRVSNYLLSNPNYYCAEAKKKAIVGKICLFIYLCNGFV